MYFLIFILYPATLNTESFSCYKSEGDKIINRTYHLKYPNNSWNAPQLRRAGRRGLVAVAAARGAARLLLHAVAAQARRWDRARVRAQPALPAHATVLIFTLWTITKYKYNIYIYHFYIILFLLVQCYIYVNTDKKLHHKAIQLYCLNWRTYINNYTQTLKVTFPLKYTILNLPHMQKFASLHHYYTYTY